MNEVNKLSEPSELNELNEQTESELVSRTVQSSATHTQKKTARRHPDSLQAATHRFRLNGIHGLNVLNQMKTPSELLQ